ncbi:TPA: Tfp pilus assembly protein FimT/FimU [Stenotrophomonas maltophilia]
MHRTPAHCRSAPRGMHLVEMLVVIAVLAVLLTVSWPAMRSMLLQQRSESTRFNLQSGLATARSQAIAAELLPARSVISLVAQ